MLTELIYQWNPFNIYGIEVGVEDLICHPLQPTETLRQDHYGHCRRIKAPLPDSTLWEKFIFWLQTHLNEKGHLEAIDKLISLLYEQLLHDPPQLTEKLQEFNNQLDKLNCLKNDYGFVYLKQGDPHWVELRIYEVKQHAYSMFEYYYQQQALEQEEARKKAFVVFQEKIEKKLEELAVNYLFGLQKSRLLTVASYEILPLLFEERMENLQERLKIIQELTDQVDEIEKMHEGKFTIPFIKNYIKRLRFRLHHELQKIGYEAKMSVGNLIINYHITPFKDRVKLFLDFIQVDPDDIEND